MTEIRYIHTSDYSAYYNLYILCKSICRLIDLGNNRRKKPKKIAWYETIVNLYITCTLHNVTKKL
jgi:hypothetical protein